MRTISLVITTVLLAILVVALVWLSHRPALPAASPPPVAAMVPGAALRLGLIPERDVFAQRRAYRELADYLGRKLGLRIELVTVNSYRAVLEDFHEQQVDGAFLGSLVTVLAVDREGAQITVKPEYAGGVSEYHGVMFVRGDSAIRSLDDLAGHSLGVVHTTTGGNVFPMWLLLQRHMLDGPRAPRLVWIGTHDDVVAQVAAQSVDAGAVKDRRLDAFEKAHAEMKFRRLATSAAVPENALVLRRGFPAAQRAALTQALLAMGHDPEAARALGMLGITRFLPCSTDQYGVIYDLVGQLGPAWKRLEIEGPAPQRPAAGEGE